jgi:hypothetical protein
MGATMALFRTHLRSWVSAKGFLIVALAGLLPVVLVGAWVVTHQADISPDEPTLSLTSIKEGDPVVLTVAVRNIGTSNAGNFNASLSIGRVSGNQLIPDATKEDTVSGLAPGASALVTVDWTAKAGSWWILADTDSADTVGEKEEFNNQKLVPVVVGYRLPSAVTAPTAPNNLTGNDSAPVATDLTMTALRLPPGSHVRGDNLTFSSMVTNTGTEAVTNVTVALRVGRGFGGPLAAFSENITQVDLAAGESKEILLLWREATEGPYWAQAYVDPGDLVSDPDGTNNMEVASLVVDPKPAGEKPPPPPDRLTIKDFYASILGLLHLRILIPFIALFYAGGVIADEKEAGTLPYLLTRPLSRSAIPIAKFLAGFVVAAVAVSIGIVVTFLILFGTPEGNVGFLTTPLFASLVTLFVYGGFFTLLGIVVDRPYLLGVAFVLGWETIAGLFVPWVKTLTIGNYIQEAAKSWKVDEGLQWLPSDEASMGALRIVIVAGIAFLALSAWTMRRREFDL